MQPDALALGGDRDQHYLRAQRRGEGDRDGAAEHADDAAAGLVELGPELGVHEHVELVERRPRRSLRRQHALRHHEERRGDGAVAMQLLELLAVGLDLDRDRREEAGDAAGGEQHVTEQLERLLAPLRRDSAHVPERSPPRVEIGGRHKQPAAARMLGRDLGE